MDSTIQNLITNLEEAIDGAQTKNWRIDHGLITDTDNQVVCQCWGKTEDDFINRHNIERYIVAANPANIKALVDEVKRLTTLVNIYQQDIREGMEAFKSLALRVVEFAGELQSIGMDAAANEIIIEILGNRLVAPNYHALKAEVEQLKVANCQLLEQLKSNTNQVQPLPRSS